MAIYVPEQHPVTEEKTRRITYPWLQLVNQLTGFFPVNLATNVTGVLPTANGGTSVNIATQALPLGSGQITFPAVQNPSANANTLDDYEEGTWTPVDGSGVGLVFTTGSAQYLKVGQGVWLSFHVVYPVTADPTNASIGGFPFVLQTTAQAVYGGVSIFQNSLTAVSWLALSAASNAIAVNTSTGANISNANLSTRTVRGVLMYRAAA
jgi:hypothetical protein